MASIVRDSRFAGYVAQLAISPEGQSSVRKLSLGPVTVRYKVESALGWWMLPLEEARTGQGDGALESSAIFVISANWSHPAVHLTAHRRPTLPCRPCTIRQRGIAHAPALAAHNRGRQHLYDALVSVIRYMVPPMVTDYGSATCTSQSFSSTTTSLIATKRSTLHQDSTSPSAQIIQASRHFLKR